MYPLTCHDGSNHNFDLEQDQIISCSNCGASFSQYQEAYQKLTDIADSLNDMVEMTNSGKPEALADMMYKAMCKTHRTSQQNFIRGLALFIKKMGEMPTDGRNYDCVEWCHKVSEIEAGFPII